MIDAALLQSTAIPELKKLDQGSETLKAFSERLELLRKEPPFPKLEELQGGKAFLSSCQAVQDAQQKVREAWKQQEHVKKTCSVESTDESDKQKHEEANVALEQAQNNLTKAMEDCERTANVVLDSPELSTFLSDRCDSKMLARLVQLTVLTQARPTALAEWCDTNDANDDPIAHSVARDLKRALLNDIEAQEVTAMLLSCLESGGARKGQYCRALEIYHRLLTQDCTKHSVLKRLALAVALELAEPYELFGNCGKTHPYRRFDHYAKAYANGELDPVLPRLDVWELRHVVDSDAPDEALEWGRISLQNYRPDLVGSTNHQWRYCQIVRTDVAYCNPTWYKEPRSYDQILSGGGKCGPRAWYGRFVCKAFGIPTWGCRQPGHAAMARWTYDGWQPCLGGGLHKSWWEGQSGNDFVLETKARNACNSETEYATKVSRLEWVAQCLNEVKRDDIPGPNVPWYTLSTMQRQRLAKTRETIQPNFNEQLYNPSVPNKVRALMQVPAAQESIVQEPNGTLVIPAGTCQNHPQVMFMRQYDANGKLQVWVKEHGILVYDLQKSIGALTCADDSDGSSKHALYFSLTLVVCTVHRQEERILVVGSSNAQNDMGGSEGAVIDVPYTMGYWKETTPVVVSLDTSGGMLKLERTKQSFGVSIKEVRLVPKEF